MYADSDTSPYRLFLNIPKLVKSYTSSSPIMRFLRPMNMWTNAPSNEAKIQTLNSALNLMLNHEAEHLLQLLDPQERAKIEKSMQTTQNVKRTALASTIAGVGGMVANQLLLSNGVYSNALPNAAAALAAGGIIVYSVSEGISGTLSAHEKDAQQAEFGSEGTAFSPFTISLKKPSS